jgi:hypothetical protein
MEMTLFPLKLGLLSFWGLWLLLAFLTNLCEWLKVVRIVPQKWTFASQNFQAVARATATYHAPPWIPRGLFLGVLLWQLLTLIFFGWAIVSSAMAGALARGALNAAFTTSIGLLAAFMIADEIFKEYDLERGHVLLLTVQLVTLIGLYVLPP